MGYVYFIHGASTGCVKIGRASDPLRRFKELRTSSAEELTFLGCVEVDDPKFAERELHRLWGPWRVRGEWFEGIPELLAFVKKACRITYARRRTTLTQDALSVRPEAAAPRPRPRNRVDRLAAYKAARGLSE